MGHLWKAGVRRSAHHFSALSDFLNPFQQEVFKPGREEGTKSILVYPTAALHHSALYRSMSKCTLCANLTLSL
jgi:hypothetical protein